MRTRRSTVTRGLLAASAAAGLVAALGSGSPASAGAGAAPAASAPAKTISMRSDKQRGLHFTGSTSVASGQQLRVRNLSDPKKAGPHTLTLVSLDVLPRSRKAMKECFTPGKVCTTAAKAHEINMKTFKVGKPLVEAGQPGWDRRFSRTSKTGDSWYTEKKGEEFSQVVSAKPGTLLRYFCIVHPEMQGQIKVTG